LRPVRAEDAPRQAPRSVGTRRRRADLHRRRVRAGAHGRAEHRGRPLRGRRPGGRDPRRGGTHPHGLRPGDPDRRHHGPADVQRAQQRPRRRPGHLARQQWLMSRPARPEPSPLSPSHGRERCGVLLVQLGTPDEPEPAAVRRYLAEFLSDPRVVEIPRALWLPVLHGVVLRTRPARSAQKYRQVWTDQGSPLLVNTRLQASLLRGLLGEQGVEVVVDFAMRYGNPSIPAVLQGMRESGVARLLVVPMYPQYSGTTTATACDAVFAELGRWRNQPELRTIRSFPDDEAFIDALAGRIQARWASEGRPDHLLMSFHGVPERTVRLGDTYRVECELTARLL